MLLSGIVSSEETQYIRTVDSLIASRLSLKVQLQAIHFATAASNSHMINALSNAATGGAGSSGYGLYGSASASSIGNGAGANGAGTAASGAGGGGGGGGLLLRCTAQIGDLYQEYKEIELGTPQKDPIPARVNEKTTSVESTLCVVLCPDYI
uniref:Uncharacterized protein n=1 Tax=Glossina brevipalpis TaxID=37001 RepID=A0A1A9WNP0_9MUSC